MYRIYLQYTPPVHSPWYRHAYMTFPPPAIESKYWCGLQITIIGPKFWSALQIAIIGIESKFIFSQYLCYWWYKSFIFQTLFFYRTEFIVWNISGLIHLFVKKKSLRKKKSLSGFEYQCFENAGFLFYTCVWCFMYACPRFNSIYLDMHLNLEIKTIWKSVKLNVKQFISIYWNTKIYFWQFLF